MSVSNLFINYVSFTKDNKSSIEYVVGKNQEIIFKLSDTSSNRSFNTSCELTNCMEKEFETSDSQFSSQGLIFSLIVNFLVEGHSQYRNSQTMDVNKCKVIL